MDDWLDATLKTKVVEVGGFDVVAGAPQGEDDASCVSSSMSTVTRSTVVTKSTRTNTSAEDSRYWTVDSRGKLFESDDYEKRAEDLDAWLDSVIE